jgi:hypothetical protein
VRKVLGVMQKDAQKWKDTGGWGAVGANAAAACFQCHASQKDRDFVFSGYRK